MITTECSELDTVVGSIVAFDGMQTKEWEEEQGELY